MWFFSIAKKHIFGKATTSNALFAKYFPVAKQATRKAMELAPNSPNYRSHLPATLLL